MIIQKRKQMFVAKQKGTPVTAVIGSVRSIVFERMDNLITGAFHGSNSKHATGR